MCLLRNYAQILGISTSICAGMLTVSAVVDLISTTKWDTPKDEDISNRTQVIREI